MFFIVHIMKQTILHYYRYNIWKLLPPVVEHKQVVGDTYLHYIIVRLSTIISLRTNWVRRVPPLTLTP